MAKYKQRYDGCIIRTTDGATIPGSLDNSDYVEYLGWVALGNTPDPADPSPLTYDEGGRLQARVTTTSAAPTQLFRVALPQTTGFVAELKVIGVDLGNGAMYARKGDLTIKRLNAGAMIVGSNIDPPMKDSPAADTWNVTGAVSGNDFVVTVTGAAGRTIAWSLNGTYISFTPNGR